MKKIRECSAESVSAGILLYWREKGNVSIAKMLGELRRSQQNHCPVEQAQTVYPQDHEQINDCIKPLRFGLVCYGGKAKLANTYPDTVKSSALSPMDLKSLQYLKYVFVESGICSWISVVGPVQAALWPSEHILIPGAFSCKVLLFTPGPQEIKDLMAIEYKHHSWFQI